MELPIDCVGTSMEGAAVLIYGAGTATATLVIQLLRL